MADTLARDIESILNNNRNKMDKMIAKLELINPIGVLKRGYAICYKDNKSIKTVKGIKKDDNINVELNSGNIKAQVIEIKE